MFTGLVATIGRIASVRTAGRGMTLVVEHDPALGELERGESIAVDGCCLTAVAMKPGSFRADVSPETLSRTGGRSRWRGGRRVNLERALALGDRLGGHVVQGHVDGLLRLVGIKRLAGGWVNLRLELPREARHRVVEKGSVALDGVSLTVARRESRHFEVAVIPETLDATTLSERRPGDRLTVEYDVLARYAAAARAAGREHH